MNFRITGTGSYLPKRIVTNNDLAKIVETSDEWIQQRIGIRERRIATDETCADMAVSAAESALENAGVRADELDMILSLIHI